MSGNCSEPIHAILILEHVGPPVVPHRTAKSPPQNPAQNPAQKPGPRTAPFEAETNELDHIILAILDSYPEAKIAVCEAIERFHYKS